MQLAATNPEKTVLKVRTVKIFMK